MDGSKKITYNAQFIFIRDTDNAFHIDEDLLIYVAWKVVWLAKFFPQT